jgi:N6-L-threonylcarbamoyladenine synthase
MKILAVETSCDDTGIAIIEKKIKGQPKLLANLVSSQIKVHAPWGGVVPMLAKREHQKNIVPLLKQALKESRLLKTNKPKIGIQNSIAKIKSLEKILERENDLQKNLIPFLKKYQKPKIDCIAVTIGPGLEPALWVGVNFAQALASFWSLPVIPVNHIEGHIIASFFNVKKTPGLFPAVALIVSGGHTQIVLIKKTNKYQIIGETRDDAAGEAFDKVAKMLNLGYPGGPAISRLTEKYKSQEPMTSNQKNNIPKTTNHKLKTKNLSFPRPMINSGDFDFSFSGLKTAVLYSLQKMNPTQIKKLTPAIAAEFQQAVIDVLTAKTFSAAKKFNAKSIILAGGVSANLTLRNKFQEESNKQNLIFLAPEQNLCTDNAAMIALAANPKKGKNKKPKLQAKANLRI